MNWKNVLFSASAQVSTAPYVHVTLKRFAMTNEARRNRVCLVIAFVNFDDFQMLDSPGVDDLEHMSCTAYAKVSKTRLLLSTQSYQAIKVRKIPSLAQ
jgi:hypothetical protein